MKKKKIPLRVCAGCQEQKSKKEMIRIVRTPEGNVEIDKTGKKSGRGVYICQNPDCLEKTGSDRELLCDGVEAAACGDGFRPDL